MTIKTHQRKSILVGYLFFVGVIFLIISIINKAFAQPNDTENSANKVSAVSIGQVKVPNQNQQTHIDTLRDNLLVQAAVKSNAFASGKIRDVAKKAKRNARGSFHHFDIFQAQSYLIKDQDHDGYYQEFTVTFDADVNSFEADVYAELYLSKNGGPWRHYYTTDVFTIFGDSNQDEYEVFTRLVDGYNPDEYDVLIDLYEVGYSDIVASFSADDTNNLYALPLESVYNDSYHGADNGNYYASSHGHGGSLSLFGLVIILVTGIYRRLF